MKKNILILHSRLKLKSTYEPKFKKTNVVFAKMCQNARDNFFSPNQGENLLKRIKIRTYKVCSESNAQGEITSKNVSLEDHLF